MEAAAVQPKILMRGAMGVRLDVLAAEHLDLLKRRLTVTTIPYKDNPAQRVEAFEIDDDHIWLPRYFDYREYWPKIRHWEWVSPALFYDFKPGCLVPDPARKQPEAIEALTAMLRRDSATIGVLPTGVGKCLGKGTPVMLADGRVIAVEQVKIGDRLMGPDGEPRSVLSTNVGRGPLYRIDPIKGEPWVCNDVHVLTLANSSTSEIVDVSLDKWHAASSTFRHLHKQFSVGVESFTNDLPAPSVDPYFLGLWFGDGSHYTVVQSEGETIPGVAVSKPDPEVKAVCESVAGQWGLRVRTTPTDGGKCPTYCLVGQRKRPNPLLVALRELVGTHVCVPDEVRRGGRETRRQFLAGLLDADAELANNCFVLAQKREDWARAAWWIARSLGLCATITTRTSRDQNGTEGTYFVVTISGDTDQIPTRIPRKQAKPRKQKKTATRTGFRTTPIGEGDYYGFTLDGDGRFLMGDFTVTHNTLISLLTAKNFKTPIGVLIYAGHQIDNWIEHAESVLGVPREDVGIVKEDRCDLGKPITIISIQTVMARDLPPQLFNQIGFICADEIHHFGAAKWSRVVSKFKARYRLGVSADPIRDDGLDPVVRWNFGKVGYAIHTRPTGERPLVCLIRYPGNYEERKYVDWKKGEDDKWEPGSPNSMKYDKLLMRDKARNTWLVELIMDGRSKGRRVLILGRHREHIEDLHDRFVAKWTIAQAKLSKDSTTGAVREETKISLLWGGLSDKQRQAAQTADVIFATHGFAREALNLPQLDTLIFATPPGDPLQPVGRLRDKGPADRKSLLALDPFEPNDYSFKKAMRRKQSYDSLGLRVKRVTKQ